jgi:hypothetical protein
VSTQSSRSIAKIDALEPQIKELKQKQEQEEFKSSPPPRRPASEILSSKVPEDKKPEEKKPESRQAGRKKP